jgi:hypothetical protein
MQDERTRQPQGSERRLKAHGARRGIPSDKERRWAAGSEADPQTSSAMRLAARVAPSVSTGR